MPAPRKGVGGGPPVGGAPARAGGTHYAGQGTWVGEGEPGIRGLARHGVSRGCDPAVVACMHMLYMLRKGVLLERTYMYIHTLTLV